MGQKAVLACACECGEPAGDEEETWIGRFHKKWREGVSNDVASCGVGAKTVVEGIANVTKLVVIAVSGHQIEGSTCIHELDRVDGEIPKEIIRG